jgi:hypothetical protein
MMYCTVIPRGQAVPACYLAWELGLLSAPVSEGTARPMRGVFDAWAELLASYHGDVGGFAAGLPLSRHRCNHLTAELALTSKRSAASRRDAPISTALIARSRSSPEQAFGILNPRKGESMHEDSLIRSTLFAWNEKSDGLLTEYDSYSHGRR